MRLPNDSRLQAAFEDFSLAWRAHATLALTKDLSHANIDIKAHQGQILVSGAIPDWVSEDHISAQIRSIPGVKEVRADLVNLSPALG